MKTPFKLRSGNNIGGRNGKGVNFKAMAASPVKQTDFISSFTNFLKSKQSDVAGKVGDVDVTNREIGELRRKSRYSQNFREKMEAKKKLRDFYKREKAGKVKPKETIEKVKIKPKIKVNEPFKPHEFIREGGDPYSYRTKEGGGYEFKSLKGKGGRTKGEWYTATGGVADIEKAYKKALEIE